MSRRHLPTARAPAEIPAEVTRDRHPRIAGVPQRRQAWLAVCNAQGGAPRLQLGLGRTRRVLCLPRGHVRVRRPLPGPLDPPGHAARG
eukprot:6266975-Prymnesium_polylepis.1